MADEPLLEATAPLPEAQFVETLVLNAVCYQTLLASKAARCVLAAEGRPVVDFSLRRAHGEEAGLRAARAAAIAGFSATSNVAGALRYGLQATGTMAHSYVQAFPSEEEAFRAFATDFPAAAVFLVDTFDLVDGVHAAVRVIEQLGLADRAGIRIDSGDMEYAARTARAILDEHGLRHVRIVASGGLDEFVIDRCVRREVPIDVFAVGTRFGVSADAPVLDAAYKLVQVGDRPTMKLSPGKATAPGAKQVFRRPHYEDLLGLRGEPVPIDAEPLLVPVVRAGRSVLPADSLSAAYERCAADLAALPATARQLRDPVAPDVPVDREAHEGRRRVAGGLALSGIERPDRRAPGMIGLNASGLSGKGQCSVRGTTRGRSRSCVALLAGCFAADRGTPGSLRAASTAQCGSATGCDRSTAARCSGC